MRTVITAGHLFTPYEFIGSPIVVVEDGRINLLSSVAATELPNARRLDFPGLVLAPGFIDVHIHGGAGHDVMEADETALQEFERHLLRHGVTAYLPTTITAPQEKIIATLDRLSRRISKSANSNSGACALGIHLEGPFISHEKRGVHPSENLLQPSPAMLEKFWQASHGNLKMMTIAPELTGARDTIAFAQSLGIISSLGHSNASVEEAESAILAGASHATHTFNAMRALDHRSPGLLGAILNNDRISADIIADGIHVHPDVVGLFLRAKGAEHAILITDAISATGMPDGTYKLGSFDVEVKDGRCDYQGRLAGSVLTLDRALRNAMKFSGWNIQETLGLVTSNPAKLLGVTAERGVLAVGSRADMVALTLEGEVVHTIVAGEIVH
jgi:N-acetylglucosamine-6-phosphate deacetylase